MPAQPRARRETPAATTYRSTGAAPQQRLFPHRRQHIKTYGGNRKAKDRQQDNTLTQMDFVAPTQASSVLTDEETGQDEDVADQPLPAKPKRSERESRRRTMGDTGEFHMAGRDSKRRKTMGDSPTVNSSFHTQTLTQFLSNPDQDENWQINDSEEDELILETPTKPSSSTKVISAETAEQVASRLATPTKKSRVLEVRSSESPATPDTPDSASTPILLRHHPMSQNSPSKYKSSPLKEPVVASGIGSRTPRDHVVHDSYTTTQGSIRTPTPKSSRTRNGVVKQIRFDLPEDKENITPGRTKPKSPKVVDSNRKKRNPLQDREIPDSDDDFEDSDDEVGTEIDTEVEENAEAVEIHESDSPEECGTPTPAAPRHDREMSYEAGEDTQAHLLLSGYQAEEEEGEPSAIAKSTPEQSEDLVTEIETTSHTELSNVQLESPIIEQTPTSPLVEDTEELPSHTQSCTQGLESQRLPMEVIRELGPQGPRSDIIISLHPEHLNRILDRTKTHEFRTWLIPAHVHRIWVYATKPLSELKYLMMLGPAKQPGELEDETGVGNADFNQGKKTAKFAYQVLQVYQLNNPVSLATMKANGWVNGAPQKYIYVPPAIVGRLTANLRCPLFGPAVDDEDVLVNDDQTVSQELEEQLRSETELATQAPVPKSDEEIIPSTQSPASPVRRTSPRNRQEFVKPAPPLPKSHINASLPPPIPSSQARPGLVRASQATTVSQLSSSSQVQSPPRLALMDQNSCPSREAPGSDDISSSPVLFRRDYQELRSSQFKTRSQMLPASLLDAEFHSPPQLVDDSDDDISE